MSFVDIHPHFVSARNYDDVKTVVGLLKDPIDDGEFKRPVGAPFLPPACTSTIHVTGSLSNITTARNSNSCEDSTMAEEKKGCKSIRAAHCADYVHAPFGNNTACDPLAQELETSISPYNTSVPKSQAPPPASATEFKMRRRASSYRQKSDQQKILCVWDVDDTLVATGVSGVRQNLVFKEPELVSLFRSAGPRTRHLLLSQGSIDDVFEESGGRLRCIQNFVQGAPLTSNRGLCSASNAKSTGGGGCHTSATHTGKASKKKSSFADIMRCGSGKQTKDQPTTASSDGVNSTRHGRSAKNPDKGVGGTNEHDMRQFAPGTVLVRLSSVYDRAEEAADSAFLTNSMKQPTCDRTSTVPLDEKAERMGRWLILRPEVWGITLASMNTIFPPSRNTAFVNGKVYRKMDVVWSLAMTGQWDSVFFIDNNLSEVGVVRYGMQMSDVLNLRSGRQMWRFFQSEFLLLAAAAKLREMEQCYGRDVTKPPPSAQSNEENNDNNNSVTNKAVNQKDSAKLVGSSCELRIKATGTGSGDGAGDGGELTPSKSTVTSSSDSVTLRGGNRPCSHANLDKKDPSGPMHVDLEEDIQIIDHPASSSPKMPGDATAVSSNRSECLSLDSSGSQKPKTRSSPSLTSPVRSTKDVDLVVVNFHMSCDAYRRVLTTARTNNDGQRAMRREGREPTRFVGQPVFIGDRSCTDEQYEAILKYFQETESGLFQSLEEDMRIKGYVDLRLGKRWVPHVHTIYAPIHKRPTSIPHMPIYYTQYFDEVEERVVKTLQKYGGTSSSCPLHSEAQRQYFVLQRVLPFIDPYLTGDLGRILFDIYIVDGNISRSLADVLKKILNKTRDRIIPPTDRK